MKSPIVEVVVGSGDDRTTYSAHQAVIIKSPELAKQVDAFAPGGVRAASTNAVIKPCSLTTYSPAKLCTPIAMWTPWVP